MAKTCEEKSLMCSASEGYCCYERTPPAATCRWLAGCDTPQVLREKSAVATLESI